MLCQQGVIKNIIHKQINDTFIILTKAKPPNTDPNIKQLINLIIKEFVSSFFLLIIQQPWHRFGKNPRKLLGTGPFYDYHLRQDLDFDVNEADKVRRGKRLQVRIGLESRFINDPKKYKATPGPQYNPAHPLHKPSKTKYTFGYKRDIRGAAPLKLLISTPKIVGPGAYNTHKSLNQGVKSRNKTKPRYSFPKNKRLLLQHRKGQNRETYDTQESTGFQPNSKKQTMPHIAFGKADRNYRSGMFKAHMATSPTKVRIAHPRVRR